MRPIVGLASVVLTPLLKQLLGLKNARWMSVHEVVVRPSLGKRVPLGRLPNQVVTPLYGALRLIGARLVECRRR
jgi:hypothetical protein